MTAIKEVLIVGTGLIGGSLALCLKAAQPEVRISALDPQAGSGDAALAAGAVDQLVTDFLEAARGVDMIFLCTPVKVTIQLIQELATVKLERPLLVSDVGSTKQEIMAAAQILTDPLVTFIGGHPMAGSHKSGFIAADVDLFENAYYVLTPQDETPTESVALLKDVLKGTRAKFLVLGAAEHDQVTGIVSHLPHVIASGLVAQKAQFAATLPAVDLLAAGGFRDITRIASSDPTMWTDILLSNKTVLLEQLAAWQGQMTTVAEWLAQEDRGQIFNYFAAAKAVRDALPVRQAGAIPHFNDLFVELPDYAGEIAAITGILAQANLSLTNLKILENREDIFGTLQLTLKHLKDVAIARALLEKENYTCYEK